MKVKILKKGIRIDTKYYPCFYSKGKLINHPENSVTIYAKTYDHFPKELNPINDTEIISDYIEQDRIILHPDHPLHADVFKYAK